MIARAADLGVRVFDTAPSYGAGEAERRLGEALRRLGLPDAIVSTKAGLLASGLTRRRRDFTPTGVRRSVEASLRRLRRDSIDCLFLHGPSAIELTDELLTTLADLIASGDIRAIGVCGRGAELDAALASGCFSQFMAPVHAGLAEDDRKRLTRLRAAGELIGIETLASLGAGRGLSLSPGQIWRLARAVRGAPPRPAAGPSTVDGAIRWSLEEGCAHRIVTTTSRPEHLESSVAAAMRAQR